MEGDTWRSMQFGALANYFATTLMRANSLAYSQSFNLGSPRLIIGFIFPAQMFRSNTIRIRTEMATLMILPTTELGLRENSLVVANYPMDIKLGFILLAFFFGL